MKSKWFLKFLVKSIVLRKGHIIIASLSVTLAVLIVTAMMGITIGINEKLGSELKAYGANIIVSGQTGGYLDYNALDSITAIENVNSVEGQIFGNAVTAQQSVEIIGLNVESIKETGWRLSGEWPVEKKEILAGINLKESLGLEKGKTIYLQHESRVLPAVVSGFIERGGPEDNALIMQLTDAWELTGLNNKLSAVLVRGRSGQLEEIVKSIRQAEPSALVKTFRQVALAEKSLLDKIQLLMVLVTIAVLFSAGISVTSTMGANVLERREEIGLMKAIGATNREISYFYISEALLTGLIGGLAGYVLGYISAQAISNGAFNSYIQMPLYLFFTSVTMGVMLSLFASHFPVRDALKANPAVILRGE